MKETVSWLTPKQAGKLSGYTGRHITNLIIKGRLSATKEDGKYYIDKSEFFRVFPDAHLKEQHGNSAEKAEEKARIEMENNLLREMSSQKDKEIEFLRNQVENVAIEKSKMLEAIVNQTRILEYQKTNDSQVKKTGWKNLFGLLKK